MLSRAEHELFFITSGTERNELIIVPMLRQSFPH